MAALTNRGRSTVSPAPARVAKLGAEFRKLKRGKIGIGGELLKSPFALNLLHGFASF